MKRQTFLMGAYRALLSLLILPLMSSAPVRAQEKPALTISAAASLKDVLTAINSGYSGATVSVNFGSSGSLQRQIEQGAPVDVFISAAAKNMDELEKAKLVDSATRKDIAANRLVLVTPKDGAALHSFKDLAKPAVKRFAMGEPGSVPAGKYAKEVLTNLKIYDAVQPKAVLGKDVREVLTQVELGNVDAGIVYTSDALSSQNVRIAATAPAKLHQPIRYPAAVVSDSKNKDAAGEYLRFLSTSTAKKLFKKFGFLPPAK